MFKKGALVIKLVVDKGGFSMKLNYLSTLLVTGSLILTGCATNETEKEETNIASEEHMHSSSSELPEGLESAENPTYKQGSQVIIRADHMEGMNGAEATVLDAFNTTAYVISYTPTTGGEVVTNHKWVIQEELKDVGEEELQPGTEVVLEADHMPA